MALNKDEFKENVWWKLQVDRCDRDLFVCLLLLLVVEVCKFCDAVLLVAGAPQFERKGRCITGVCGQQGLKVRLSCLLLLVQSLELLLGFLSGTPASALEP